MFSKARSLRSLTSPADLSNCTSSTGPRLSSAARSGCAVRAAARSGERERTSSTGCAGRCTRSRILASKAARQTLTSAQSRYCSSRTRDARVCLCSTVLPRLAVCAAARSGAGSRTSGTTFTCRSVFNRRFPARAYCSCQSWRLSACPRHKGHMLWPPKCHCNVQQRIQCTSRIRRRR